MATMQRSFLRAAIKLKYSEGFNPHPYMSVALPLPVGCESLYELIDIGLVDDTIPDIKTIKLPEGIIIHEAYKSSRKFNEIEWIEMSGNLHYDKLISDEIVELLNQSFEKDSIIISKKTKRGFKDLDIAPHIKDVRFSKTECVQITAKISAQNPTLNAEDLMNALDGGIRPDYADIKRIAIYDSNMVVFK